MSYFNSLDRKTLVYIIIILMVIIITPLLYTKLSSLDVTMTKSSKSDDFTEMRTGETYEELKIKYETIESETRFLKKEIERLIKDNRKLRDEKDVLEHTIKDIKSDINKLVYKMDGIENKIELRQR